MSTLHLVGSACALAFFTAALCSIARDRNRNEEQFGYLDNLAFRPSAFETKMAIISPSVAIPLPSGISFRDVWPQNARPT
jgi:hypothetical protein